MANPRKDRPKQSAQRAKPSTAPVPVDAPPCLRPEALKFLRGLKRNNDREWFTERKAIYEAELRRPMLAIVRAVNDGLEEFAPDHARPAEKALFRIYRDTRFSPDKTPYKTHQGAWWSHHRLEKTSGAGFYFHVAAEEVTIAAGAYMPEKDQLAAIRNWLLTHHEEFRELLQQPAIRSAFTEFEGNALTRPPKGFPAGHPAMDLIRSKQWGLSATLPAESALDPGFAAEIVRHFKLASPVVAALNSAILDARPADGKGYAKPLIFGLS